MTNSWKFRAACRGSDFDIWFSDSPADIREAKSICARCPVRAECWTDAEQTDLAIAYGIRAGLTGTERSELRKKQRRAEVGVP